VLGRGPLGVPAQRGASFPTALVGVDQGVCQGGDDDDVDRMGRCGDEGSSVVSLLARVASINSFASGASLPAPPPVVRSLSISASSCSFCENAACRVRTPRRNACRDWPR